jgi:hypothetical protein
MLWVVARAFAVWILLALMTVAALIAGQQRALPESFQRLHLTPCTRPCWLGMAPGEATLDAAMQRITDNFGSDHDIVWSGGPGLIRILADGTEVIVLTTDVTLREKASQEHEITFGVRYDQKTRVVQEIAFTNSETNRLPTFRELVSVYGTPNCLIQNRGLGNTPLTLLYLDQQKHVLLSARVLSRGFGWDQALFELSLNDDLPYPLYSCQPWRGFTNMEKYLPRP